MPRERMPQVDGLEIFGAHAGADGLEFSHVMQPTIRSCLIREVRRGIEIAGSSEKIVIGENIVPKGVRGDVIGR